MLARDLAYFAKADGAGIVLGARVPIVLTSRADSPEPAHGVLCGCDTLCRRAAASRPNRCGVTAMDTTWSLRPPAPLVSKFQVFAVDGDGGDCVGRSKARWMGSAASLRLRATGATGDALADRAYTIERVPDVSAALTLASAWLRDELN